MSSSLSPASSSSTAAALSPPLLIVQLFLDRLSSPWEAHFNCARPVQIRFVPISSTGSNGPTRPFADGHLRPGQGRLFIVRSDQIGWLQLDLARGEAEVGDKRRDGGGWRGRIKLVEEREEEEKGSSPVAAAVTMCRKVECELKSSSAETDETGTDATTKAAPLITLTAHLLLSVDELKRRQKTGKRKKEGERQGDGQRRKRREGMTRENMEDGWAQTEQEDDNQQAQQHKDSGGQREEIGVQTAVDERVLRQRRAASARVMMLIMMALMNRRGRRERSDGGAQQLRQQLNVIGNDARSGQREAMFGKMISHDGRLIGRVEMIRRSGREGGMIGRNNRGSGRRKQIGKEVRGIESGRETIKTRESETMTHVSIDPRANPKSLCQPNQIALISNYRAKIAYLSAVHRSIVPTVVRKRDNVERREWKSERKECIVRRERKSVREFTKGKEEMMAFEEEERREGSLTRRKMNSGGLKWAGERDEHGGEDVGGGNGSELQSIASESEADGERGKTNGGGRGMPEGSISGRGGGTMEETNKGGTGPHQQQKWRTIGNGRGKGMMEEERDGKTVEERAKNREGMMMPAEGRNGRRMTEEATRAKGERIIVGTMVQERATRGQGRMPAAVVVGQRMAQRKTAAATDAQSSSNGTLPSPASSASSSSSSHPLASVHEEKTSSSSPSSSSPSSSSSSSAKQKHLASSASYSKTKSSPSSSSSSSLGDKRSESDDRQKSSKYSSLQGSSAKTDSSIVTEIASANEANSSLDNN